MSSAYEILGVPNISARFGTAPFFWNWGMAAMTSLLSAVCLLNSLTNYKAVVDSTLLLQSLPIIHLGQQQFIISNTVGIPARQKQGSAVGKVI